jgi:hypothetical protein
MGCCLGALLALISPRLAIIALWIFGDVLSRAYSSWVLPFIGFFVLPWTTLTYALVWDWTTPHQVHGIGWFFVALAFLVDVSSIFGGRTARSRRN